MRGEMAQAPAGLRGLHHVVIGVNDVKGALAAYERLGFRVAADPPGAGGFEGRIDLDQGFLGFVSPRPDSAGKTNPYTFEGALAQGWEAQPLDSTLTRMRAHGVRWSNPETDLRIATPEIQPISGTSIYLGEFQNRQPSPPSPGERGPEPGAAGGTAGLAHPNGARRIAYVTVATQRMARPLEILRSWGLSPGAPQEDVRGSKTVEVPLARGVLYLTAPQGGGGVNDFLEERRALAPPVGDRFYEGSILAIGLAVDDLDATEEFFKRGSVPYVPMDLPSGHALVVQGAPGWGLRLEFVQR